MHVSVPKGKDVDYFQQQLQNLVTFVIPRCVCSPARVELTGFHWSAARIYIHISRRNAHLNTTCNVITKVFVVFHGRTAPTYTGYRKQLQSLIG